MEAEQITIIGEKLPHWNKERLLKIKDFLKTAYEDRKKKGRKIVVSLEYLKDGESLNHAIEKYSATGLDDILKFLQEKDIQTSAIDAHTKSAHYKTEERSYLLWRAWKCSYNEIKILSPDACLYLVLAEPHSNYFVDRIKKELDVAPQLVVVD